MNLCKYCMAGIGAIVGAAVHAYIGVPVMGIAMIVGITAMFMHRKAIMAKIKGLKK